MANRLFSLLLFLALVVTGCASESVEQPAADAAEEVDALRREHTRAISRAVAVAAREAEARALAEAAAEAAKQRADAADELCERATKEARAAMAAAEEDAAQQQRAAAEKSRSLEKENAELRETRLKLGAMLAGLMEI